MERIEDVASAGAGDRPAALVRTRSLHQSVRRRWQCLSSCEDTRSARSPGRRRREPLVDRGVRAGTRIGTLCRPRQPVRRGVLARSYGCRLLASEHGQSRHTIRRVSVLGLGQSLEDGAGWSVHAEQHAGQSKVVFRRLPVVQGRHPVGDTGSVATTRLRPETGSSASPTLGPAIWSTSTRRIQRLSATATSGGPLTTRSMSSTG